MKIRGWYKRIPDATRLEPEREYVRIERDYDDAFGYGLRHPAGFSALVLKEDALAALEAELARVTKERDALMAKWAIESDESLTECVERNIDGWKQRCLRAEAAIEQARKEEREEIHALLEARQRRTNIKAAFLELEHSMKAIRASKP